MESLKLFLIIMQPFIIIGIILFFVVRRGIKKLDSNPKLRNNGIRPAWDRNPISSYFRWRGKISQQKRNFDKAHYWYTRSLNAEAKNPLTLIHKGRAYFEAENYEAAREVFNEIIQIDPINYWAFANLALIAFEERSYNHVIKYANRAIEEESQIADAYIVRMQAYLRTNQFNEALNDVNFVWDKKPALKLMFISYRVAILTRLARFEDALQDLTIELKKMPKESILYNERAWTYAHAGQFSNAILDINNAINLHDNISAFYDTRAVIFSLQENYELALSDALTAKKLSDADAIVHQITHAIVLQRAGYQDDALDMWKSIRVHAKQEPQFDIYNFDTPFSEQIQNEYHYPASLYQVILELEKQTKS